MIEATIGVMIEATVEARQSFFVQSCFRPLNFKRMANLPAISFLENQRYGLQAREQGFQNNAPLYLNHNIA